MTNTTLGGVGGRLQVQDALGRVGTPREKREQTLDEYQRSGMSVAAFVGLKYPTLARLSQLAAKIGYFRGSEAREPA